MILIAFHLVVSGQKAPLINLKYEQNYTPTYYEVIEMYRKLDKNYNNAVLLEKGMTDSGKPLHLFVISDRKQFDPARLKAEGKAVLMILNGIHPGEPEGIDASLEFADDLLRNREGMLNLLKNTVISIVPVYNIGGHLNRSAFNRSGQSTPYETGFRGSAANLDLNRDFTKCDSENAKSFIRIFHEWNPDVLLDTHTTNGSDHQYSITLIAPQPDLFPPVMENFLRNKFLPSLYSGMKMGQYELIPYVDWFSRNPGAGIAMTQESPRYSNGYCAMFHTYGMITETQIYKKFPDRVKSTYQFIRTLAEFVSENSGEIMKSREEGIRESKSALGFTLVHKLDTSVSRLIEFKGYEIDQKQISKVTGLPRFGYDVSKPFTRNIPFYDTYIPVETVRIPEYYIVPSAWKPVIDLLRLNNIRFSVFKKDTILDVSVEYIDEYTSPPAPYNGHFYHQKITTRNESQKIRILEGDLLVPVRQDGINYLIQMLEPRAIDSFLRWNFYDSVLDTREYYSNYGFEENALKYLDDHPGFRKQFEALQKSDTAFARNHGRQMAYIYNNTEWTEKTFKRYPVIKIFTKSFSPGY